MSSKILTSWRYFQKFQFPDDKFERITFKSNDLSQTFFCIPDASVLVTGILSILKPDVMAIKGYSFQDHEKTIIDTDIYMDIVVVEKEKNEWMRKMYLYFFLKNLKFQNFLNVFVSKKWRIFSCLTKLVTDEIF